MSYKNQKYYLSDPQKHIEQRKEYYQKHKDQAKARMKAYREKNLDPLSAVFSMYKSKAKQHNKEFTLTKEFFKEHWETTCYYCGAKLTKVSFDKLDPQRGYTPDNVVPCCWVCNRMKGDMSKESFIAHLRKISIKAF